MSLIKPIKTKSGIDLPNAYFKVIDQGGNKEQIKILVATYASEETKINRCGVVEVSEYSFVPVVGPGAKDFLAQGYDYLKTLPEFAGAVDV